MDDQQPAVVVKDLYKTFKLPHDQHSGLKQLLVNFYKRDKGYETQKVLNGVSFEIKKGEFFGIVGRNGSGKSTLLKLLAGIYAPDSGLVQVNGSLTPFIELGVGFNPELTGRENVFLNGALLGFSRKEMEGMYDDIVEFAELEKFMDQKLKNYSSGMQVRLAFSIAIRAQGDILLLDEVLAVGDEAFQRKCYSYFEELRRNKKTVILVTHDMGAVERFCDRAILIDRGEIIDSGESKIVAHAYSRLFTTQTQDEEHNESRTRWGSGELSIVGLKVRPISPNDKRITIDIVIRCKKPVEGTLVLAYTAKSSDKRSLFGGAVKFNASSRFTNDSEANVQLTFDNILSRGDYYLDLSLRKADREDYVDFWIDAKSFSVDYGDTNGLSILTNSQLH